MYRGGVVYVRWEGGMGSQQFHDENKQNQVLQNRRPVDAGGKPASLFPAGGPIELIRISKRMPKSSMNEPWVFTNLTQILHGGAASETPIRTSPPNVLLTDVGGMAGGDS